MADKILVVEDEPALRETLVYNLNRQGYKVASAADGESAVLNARQTHPDLIILDIMLPKLDGFEVCRILRQEMNPPIIMLTARDEEIDRVIGLEMGADDYMTKPFSIRELLARVKAQLRRVRLIRAEMESGDILPREIIKFGNLTLDLSRREILLEEKLLSLKPKEFDLLLFLARHRGQVLTRDLILEHVSGVGISLAAAELSMYTFAGCVKKSSKNHPTRLASSPFAVLAIVSKAEMFYTIRARIALFYILLVLVVMFSLTLYLVDFVERTSIADLDSHLTSEAQIIAELVKPFLISDTAPEQIDTLMREVGVSIRSRITIIDAQGIVVAETLNDHNMMENHISRPEVIQAKLTGNGNAIRFSNTLGYDMFYVAVPIKSNNEIIGYSRVALSLQTVHQKIARLQSALIGASLVAVILAGLLAVWISNRTTRPLRDLILAANQMAAGKLDSRLIPSTRDEIGQLTQTFNEMASQLSVEIDDLKAERSRIAAVLSVMSDGVIIIDSLNRIQLINPAAQQMFDTASHQASGKSLFEVARHHQVEETLQKCRETGESHSAYLEIGSHRLYLQVTATPLGAAQPENTLLLFQNLTRIRRLETVRQDFISNISHELRTPLAAIKVLAETLVETGLDDPPAALKFLNRMQTQVDALTQMVEELLELSRIESGRVPIKQVPISPCQLIDQAVDRLSTQAERAFVTIEVDCSAELSQIMADPVRLVQVLINLLHNAIKFTPSGGKIVLSAQLHKKNILFSVQDYGVGIPVGDISRIFERFYKTDRARSGGGTGLGLAISRHLVEAHGGTIWAESREGEGSTFFFSIPLAPE